MDGIWFNEDDDMVFGLKSEFDSEDEFKEAANKVHIEQTGFGCLLGDIKTDVFLDVQENLKPEMLYVLKDTKVEMLTLYYADSESLEES